ncbi:MAG: choice-of-anchor Q domain-containing protein [Bacteroidota bacterium]
MPTRFFVYPNDPNGPDDILRTADDGLRLGVGSPAINAGSNALLDPHTGNDITGARRVQENIVDMGAYEAGACPAVTILYVDGSKAASGNGLSWSSAFKTLQEALNFTETCNVPKQIWVKKGIYYPTAYPEGCTNCSEPRTRSFRLKNNTAIYGGFAGGETNLNQRNIALNLTILSGNLGSSGNNTDNAYHVITSYYNDSTSKLDGFIIEGGYTPIPSGLFADFSNINYNNNSFEITHADGGGGLLV